MLKAITILQPWASLITCGAKKIETRSWETKYRGKIAIHAGASFVSPLRELSRQEPFFSKLWPELVGKTWAHENCTANTLPLGAVIAIADLVDCLKVVGKASLKINNAKRITAILENGMRVEGNELEFGDYTIGRYAWILDNVQAIKPVPAKGMQRIWNWAGDTECLTAQ